MVVASLVQFDSTHELVEEIYRKIPREREDDWHVTDLQKAKTALEAKNSDYLYLLSDRDYILKVAEIYVDQRNKERNEIMELKRELKGNREGLDDAQVALQEAENQIRTMNHSRKHENRMRQEFFQEVIDELESIQQMYDLDNFPKQLSSKTSEHFQLVVNPLFEVVADWTSDNPLFLLNEE